MPDISIEVMVENDCRISLAGNKAEEVYNYILYVLKKEQPVVKPIREIIQPSEAIKEGYLGKV